MVKARVTSTKTTVVGSIPTGGASHRSSVAERRKVPGPLVPSAKDSGVAKVRVTSVERLGEEQGGCEFDSRSLRG